MKDKLKEKLGKLHIVKDIGKSDAFYNIREVFIGEYVYPIIGSEVPITGRGSRSIKIANPEIICEKWNRLFPTDDGEITTPDELSELSDYPIIIYDWTLEPVDTPQAKHC